MDRDLLVHLHGARAQAVRPALPLLQTDAGSGLGGAYFWDDTGDQIWNCLYAKNFWHLPLPEQPLSDLRLGNGARYEVLEPGSVYRIGYDDPDDGDEIHVDLTFTAIAPPHLLGEPSGPAGALPR